MLVRVAMCQQPTFVIPQIQWVLFRESGGAEVRNDMVEAETVRKQVALLEVSDTCVGCDLDYLTDGCTRFLDPVEPDQAEGKGREAWRENRIGFHSSSGAQQGVGILA